MPFTPPTRQNPFTIPQASQASPPSLLLAHPYLPGPCRQLHPPKSPLYRPAVLRSTERTIKPSSPLTPPASSAASLNEDYVSASDGEYQGGVAIFSGNHGGGGGGGWANGVYGSDELNEMEEEGKVTGAPGRAHWKPDSEAPTCDAPMCVRNFSLVVRRHHCRRCGNVFCHSHASHLLPLNQNARFHVQGIPSRACDSCWNDYRRVMEAKRVDSLSSSASSGSTISNGLPASPVMNMGGRGIAARGAGTGQGVSNSKIGSYVGSVPRDWSWSTF